MKFSFGKDAENFTPLKITITLENEDEAADFYHLVNFVPINSNLKPEFKQYLKDFGYRMREWRPFVDMILAVGEEIGDLGGWGEMLSTMRRYATK